MLGLLLGACAPALDWREVRPEGSGLVALFPCKPASHARPVALAGASPRMTIHACTAGDVVYAVGFADMVDPGRVTAALAQLRAAAQRNIASAQPIESAPADVAGMTPNDEGVRLRLVGKRPDGATVHEELTVFARGTQVYQASVIGARIDASAAQWFFAGLKLNV